MRAFVVISSLFAAVSAEASYLAAGLPYAAIHGARVAPYASLPAIQTAHATYGVAPAIATYAAAPALAAAPIVAAAPAVTATYAAAPVAVPAAPAVAAPSVTSTQYRAGDELGNTAFGYSNINSARQEQGNAAGVVGSYSYVDEAGVHTRHYVADDFGFRVTGDNLPVAPLVTRHRRSVLAAAPLAATYATAPLTATYAASPLAATYATYAAAPLAATYAHAPLAATYAHAPLAATYAAAPLAATYAAAPVAATYAHTAAIAAPVAQREAVLTTIKLNPGHATAYRVD